MAQLDERVAFVTGGGQGIGAAIVQQLVDDGARVVVFDLNAEPAAELVGALNERHGSTVAMSFVGSVTDAVAIAAAFVAGAAEFGNEIDLLVNNAGVGTFSLIVDTEVQNWSRTVEVCLTGTFLVSREFGVRLIAAGLPGAVVNVSSLNWEAASEGIASYSAAKAGVVQLTKTLALEWAPYGIRANSIAPGSIDTPMLGGMLTPRMRDEFLKRTPLGRLGEPTDVAPVVSFLLSDDARWITGAIVPVDGGQHARLLQSYWGVLNEG